MAAKLSDKKKVVKTTSQNGSKTSSLNKSNKPYKKYRGQGR